MQQLIANHGIYGRLKAYNSEDLGLNGFDVKFDKWGIPNCVGDVANKLTATKIAH